MSINKNFVVKHGLEVNTDLLFANADFNRVGVGTTNPLYELHVNGGIGATDVTAFNSFSTKDISISGRLTAGTTGFGSVGQYLRPTPTGIAWGNFPSLRTTQSTVATQNQIAFSFPHTPGLLDVYLNGVRLTTSEYNESSIGINLIVPANAGDILDFVGYNSISTGIGTGTGIQGITILEEGSVTGTLDGVTSINFVGTGVTAVGTGAGVTVYITSESSSVSTGGTWAVTSVGINTNKNVGIGTTNPTSKLTVNGDARITGILTVGSSSITLDGSTNIINVGTGVTINGSTGDISANSITVNGQTITGGGGGGGGESYWSGNISGIHTLSNVGIGTTNATSRLTVKGNTSLETLSVSGISTFNDQVDIYSDVNVGGAIGIHTTILNSSFVISSAPEYPAELMCLDGPNNSNIYGLFSQYANETTITSRDGNSFGTIRLNQYDGFSLQTPILIPPSGNVGVGSTLPTSKLDVSGTARFYCEDGFYNTSVGIGSSVIDVNTVTLNLNAASISKPDIAILNIPNISVIQPTTALPPVFTIGHDYDGNGLDHIGLTYDNIGGSPGIGGTARIFTSNGNLKIVTDYNGFASSSNITIGSQDIIFTDSLESQEYARITSFGVGIGTANPVYNLDVIGYTRISDGLIAGSANISGVVTATTFVGDGSGLTGIIATGTGVEIRDDDAPVGTAATINFGTNISVSPISAGVVTITSADVSYWTQTAAGIHTLSSVGIATTNPQTPLQVENIYGVKTGIGTFTAAVGVAHTIDSFTISQTDFKTAEYTIHIGFGTYIQSQKVLVMQNGATAYSQEYAIMYHPELVVSIGATIAGGQLRLHATPESGITGLTTYRFTRQSML